MTTTMAAWLSAALVGFLLLIGWMFMGKDNPVEAPVSATSTIATTTDEAGAVAIPFPDNGEEKWTK